MSAPRLSEATKDAILSRYLAGDKIAAIAAAFGVHQSYPRILFKRRVAARSKAYSYPAPEPLQARGAA